MLSLSILLHFAIRKCAYWGIIVSQNNSRVRLFACPRTSEAFQLLWDHTVGLLSVLSQRHRWKALLFIIDSLFKLFSSIVKMWCMQFYVIQNVWMNDILSISVGFFGTMPSFFCWMFPNSFNSFLNYPYTTTSKNISTENKKEHNIEKENRKHMGRATREIIMTFLFIPGKLYDICYIYSILSVPLGQLPI